MTELRYWILLPLCLLSLVASPPPCGAQEPRLTDLTITNTRDNLLVYMRVQGAFRQDMTEAAHSGVPTTFSFLASLYETRSLWFDKQISEITATHTLSYDALKEEFSVTRSWEAGPARVTRSFEEARQWMTSVERLKVATIDQLQKGKSYQLRAKAELSQLTLPFYLHYVLFFLSYWDFETDWYTVDFIY
jgi:hypothetical protein